ncbi:MAG: GlsB/YeaQ/YmgE family stress response membrane protein [Candidatus Roizmanbacteria bacterium]|nr:GlsB/YeaQ/YmgE family stress response membrane protein [Candidatus Roizmanbacteria bacterium]
MNLLLWILLGLLAGWISSLIMKTDSQQGMLMDIVFGVVGAFVGGLVFNFFGLSGVTGFNVWSLMVAIVGAVALIVLGRAFSRTT